MRRTITKPKRGASSRSLSRWQRIVQAALEDVNMLRQLVVPGGSDNKVLERLGARLSGLLRSLQRAETR